MNTIIKKTMFLLGLGSVAFVGVAAAQTLSPTDELQQGLTFRQDLVSAISQGKISAADAITQLENISATGSLAANRQASLASGGTASAITKASQK
jgi:hypothetical protein